MVMVVMVIVRGGERRAGKHHQEQCGSKNFLHAKMLHDEGARIRSQMGGNQNRNGSGPARNKTGMGVNLKIR